MKRLLLIFLLLSNFSLAQNLIKVDETQVNRSHGFITVELGGQNYHYLEGIGWLEDFEGFKLSIVKNEVYLEYFSENPKILNIRYGSFPGNRIVLDIGGFARKDLQYLIASGVVERDKVLELVLPKLEYDLELLKDFGPINQDIVDEKDKTIFKIFGSDFEYRIFVLSKPTRVVIDIKDVFIAIDREIKPGVSYKRFKTGTAEGESVVNLLEIDTNVGYLKIVEAISEGQKLASLLKNGYLGINAGYFDTSNYQHIGFLKIDGKLLALPSRNRASFGFDDKKIVIDRVRTETTVSLANKDYYAVLPDQNSDIVLFATAGSQVGSEDKTIILVQDNRVISNSFGPQIVPKNGFAVVYEPVIPDLLEITSGERASFKVDIFPKVFEDVSNAVEAGPLLLKDFEDVYEPGLEHFQLNSKILDSYTQQAAIGIKEDGTLVFLVADKMIAGELIPVLQNLNVRDAMRLDSGSSATLFADSKVLNRFFSRKIVTAISFSLNK